MIKGFRKHTTHLYTVKNQNGFNNALYDFFSGIIDEDNTFSKKRIRSMVQNFPLYYPISIVIINQSFECGRVYIEAFDIDEASHQIGWL